SHCGFSVLSTITLLLLARGPGPWFRPYRPCMAYKVGRTSRRLGAGGGDGAAVEDRAGDELGGVPHRHVAAAPHDDAAGARRAALGLRRADLLVELGPGDRHRHIGRVGRRVEDVFAHRLVGAVIALRVEPAEDELAAGRGRDVPRAGGEGRDGAPPNGA